MSTTPRVDEFVERGFETMPLESRAEGGPGAAGEDETKSVFGSDEGSAAAAGEEETMSVFGSDEGSAAAAEDNFASLTSKEGSVAAGAGAAAAQHHFAGGIEEAAAADAPQTSAKRVLTSDEQLLRIFRRARFRRGVNFPGREPGAPAATAAR